MSALSEEESKFVIGKSGRQDNIDRTTETHAEYLERTKQNNAFKIVQWCLVILVIFVFLEFASNNFLPSGSNEVLKMGVEVLKMVLPLVLGFLFGKNSG